MELYHWLKGYLTENSNKSSKAFFFRAWQDIVGKKIAEFSKPVQFNTNGILIIEVKEATWLTELQFHQSQIISQYRKKFPNFEIKKIYFKVNPNLIFPDHKNNSKPYSPYFSSKADNNIQIKKTKKNFDNHLAQEFNSIEDLEIRNRLIRFKKSWLIANQKKNSKRNFVLNQVNEPRLKEKTSLNEMIVTQSIPEEKEFLNSFIFPQPMVKSHFLSLIDEFQPFDLY